MTAPADALVTVEKSSDGKSRVELRSAVDGRVLAVVLGPTKDAVSVARLSSTELLLSTVDGCRTRIERLDRATGARTVVRVLDVPAYGVEPSPDGRRIAFVTTPSCSAPQGARPGTVIAGRMQYLPSVLAVTSLAPGPLLTTATDQPGHPLFGAS